MYYGFYVRGLNVSHLANDVIMICISFIGMLIASIILGLVSAVLRGTASTKTAHTVDTINGALGFGLFMWWLIGFLVDCDKTYGPIVYIN